VSVTKDNSRGPLLDHIDAIEALCERGDPRLREILGIFGPDGHYVTLLFLVLPFLQPIPLFGLSTPFGLLIAVISVLAFLRRPTWVPARWADRTLKASSVLRIAKGSERLFAKLGVLLRPRWRPLLRGPVRLLNVFLVVINAILLALPLPVPFSNSLPALMIFLQALAHLEDDGAFIVGSYLVTVLSIVYIGLILFGISSGVAYLDQSAAL
jgi:hypothetical protein